MSRNAALESRVTVLERELDEVKRRLSTVPSVQNWLETVSGSFKNDPEFDEILRLGRELRQAGGDDSDA